MAYSNWGAIVKKNGVRMTDKEDVGVFDEDEGNLPSGMRIFANILKNRKEGEETPWYKHSHHAVLGDGAVRLCGYKCNPELVVMKKGKIEKIDLPDLCSEDGEIINASFYLYTESENPEEKIWDGRYIYSARHYDGNMIDLSLTYPNGDRWEATCGYQYGAGFED